MSIDPSGGGQSGYSTGGGGAVAIAGAPGPGAIELGRTSDKAKYWTLDQCKKAYSDYLGAKRNEIMEQQLMRRYRHGAQWSSDQVKVFNDRRQPVVTYNRLGRKIDGIVGLVEKLRRDPKAFPRSPRFTMSADLATAALRSCMDKGKWK